MGLMECWCSQRVTELGTLSSLTGVGVGLFLALAVVQVVGSREVSKLRRKAGQLKDLVFTNRYESEKTDVLQVEAELLRLELGLETLSEILFKICFALLLLSLIGMSVVSLAPKIEVGCLGIAGILFFYLALPLLVFVIASRVISRRCSEVRERIAKSLDRVLDKVANG